MKQAFRPNISQKRSSKLTQYPQLKIVFREFMDRKHLVQDSDDDIAVCSLYEVFFPGMLWKIVCMFFSMCELFHFDISLPKHVTENCTNFKEIASLECTFTGTMLAV